MSAAGPPGASPAVERTATPRLAPRRRGLALRRRRRRDRGGRGVADLPRLVVPPRSSASPRCVAAGIAAIGVAPPLERLAGRRRSLVVAFFVARRPARRAVAARRRRSSSCAASAMSRPARCSRGRTSSRSTCPVGTYRNLLVPALVVFLVGTCAGSCCRGGADRVAYAAVPVALGDGLLRPVLRPHHRQRAAASRSGHDLRAASRPRSASPACSRACCGSRGAAATSGCASLRRAAASSGVRVSRRPSRADRRRTALGAGHDRRRRRSPPRSSCRSPRAVRSATCCAPASDPRSTSPRRSARSPSTGRCSPTTRADDVLFTVDRRTARCPTRVRLATLDSYDGEIYRSGGTGAVDQARFVRVPSTLDAGSGARPWTRRSRSRASTGSGCRPSAGSHRSTSRAPARRPSPTGFYYSAAAAAGVQTAGGGLPTGDAYVVAAVEPAIAGPRRDRGARRARATAIAAPESLRTWVDEHVSGSGGAALAGPRHAPARARLPQPRARRRRRDAAVDAVAARTTRSSRARPGTRSPASTRCSRACSSARPTRGPRHPDNYVAAVGDDEQFAVGGRAHRARARLPGARRRRARGSRSADPTLRTCEDGVCRAQDLAAWTEVQSAGGDWVPIDVTPQFAQSPSLEVTEQRDPENVTEVRPDSVEEVVPPDPVQEDSGADDRADDAAALDLAVAVADRCASPASCCSCSLLALGPFLARSPRPRPRDAGRAARRATPAARIAGGWDEYVDAAIDAGRDAPPVLTRSELADVFATPPAAARSRRMPTVRCSPATGHRRARRDGLLAHRRRGASRAHRASAGSGAGVVATVSLRSFVRHLAPAPGARIALAERGKRRVRQPARTSP